MSFCQLMETVFSYRTSDNNWCSRIFFSSWSIWLICVPGSHLWCRYRRYSTKPFSFTTQDTKERLETRADIPPSTMFSHVGIAIRFFRALKTIGVQIIHPSILDASSEKIADLYFAGHIWQCSLHYASRVRVSRMDAVDARKYNAGVHASSNNY